MRGRAPLHFRHDPVVEDAAVLVPLLRPFPPDAMRAYPVGQLVSNPRNDVPRCLDPAPSAEGRLS